MKATISIDGVLTIWPETSLEGYALQRWTDHNIKNHEFPNMIIYGDPERIELKDDNPDHLKGLGVGGML